MTKMKNYWVGVGVKNLVLFTAHQPPDCVVCYHLFTLRREHLNVIRATSVGKLMIIEHCKIGINTFVPFPNDLLLDRYSWLYFSHPVNINKVAKTGYIYIKACKQGYC